MSSPPPVDDMELDSDVHEGPATQHSFDPSPPQTPARLSLEAPKDIFSYTPSAPQGETPFAGRLSPTDSVLAEWSREYMNDDTNPYYPRGNPFNQREQHASVSPPVSPTRPRSSSLLVGAPKATPSALPITHNDDGHAPDPTTAGSAETSKTHSESEEADVATDDAPADHPSEEEANEALLALLAEQSKQAQLEDDFGAFTITTTPFSDIQIPNDTRRTTTSTKQDTVQWIPLPAIDCTSELLHASGNPLDFMSESVLEECKKASAGQPHKLGNAKAILVDPGYKILIRALHKSCPHSKLPQWIKHAIRSALDMAGLPLESALSLVAMGKPGYDWYVASLTKEAYEHLSGIRAMLDPRSRVAVLLRKWNMSPQASQVINFSGINTDEDITEAAQAAARLLFQTQANAALAPHAIISSMKPFEDPRRPGPPQTQITFTITGKNRFVLNPKNLPTTFTGPGRQLRTVKASWPRRCFICHSESHLDDPACPWRTKDFEGKVYSPHNANNLAPGQTERPKRKREEEAESAGPILTDMRPTRLLKKRKTETTTNTTTNLMDVDNTPTTESAPTAAETA